MSVPRLPCGNLQPKSLESGVVDDSSVEPCPNEGKLLCAGCTLVRYCSKECQVAHRPYHKEECKSKVGQDYWQPLWVQQGRIPAFVYEDKESNGPWGVQRNVWPRHPAFDILKLAENEGQDHPEDLNLLFAACGDLGNVVQTVVNLPDEWNHRLQLTVNDGDAEIIVRSVILLLIAVFVDDIDQAIECMIHVWYSAFIRESDSELLQSLIKPMIDRVCNTIKDKDPESLRAKTWTRGNRSIKVVLKQRTWMTLPRMLDRVRQIKPIEAFASRRATVLCRYRWDHRDGFMMKLPPKQRTAHLRYLLHGLLLPFGHNRVEFVVPNPFLYRMPAQWQGNDAVNPVFAWPLHDVLEAPGAASENDVYGKLFNYLYDHLRAFIDRINKSPTFFCLLQVNPFELDKCLPHGSYDRIDATAITDKHRGFPIHALETLMPILKNKKQNPHATMIQFFETAVESRLPKSGELSKLDQDSAELKHVKKIIAVTPSSSSICSWSPEVLIYPPLIDLYASHWEVFDQYLANEKFNERVRPGTVMKQVNTIVPKFRYQLKFQEPLDAEYRRTVWRRFREPVDGKSVYLEWQKEDEEEKVKAER